MKAIPYFVFLLIGILISCKSEQNHVVQVFKQIKNGIMFLFVSTDSKELEIALDLAEEKRSELEKVLEYYKEDPEKLEAAKFLIRNMPGCYAVDSMIEKTCSPFYLKYDSLSVIYNETFPKERGVKIDSLWQAFNGNEWRQLRSSYMADLNVINADQLIGEIELAFKSWKGNVYTSKCSFEDFCEYILPYRRKNGILINNSRALFYHRHGGRFFQDSTKSFIEDADSLLFRYQNIKHSKFYGTGIPIWSPSTLEKLQYGLCDQRCWYNSTLLSALGMAATIDFVPAWGNRNGAHTWNSIIVGGITYPFEPFWDTNRWKYKQTYNNQSCDSIWGRFKLPKVYRNTYSSNIVGPLADKRVLIEDIPNLFKNCKIKDVSSAYFETSDVRIKLTRNSPPDCYYAYLCVFGNQQWHIVQWGKIENNQVSFKDMGRGIVYLPVYYKNGTIIFASDPFLLQENGQIKSLAVTAIKERIAVRGLYGEHQYDPNVMNFNYIRNLIVVGAKTKDFIIADTLTHIGDTVDMSGINLRLKKIKKCRYIRVLLPTDTFALNDLKFFEKSYNEVKPISGISFLTKFNKSLNGNGNENEKHILDFYGSSGFKVIVPEKYVDVDLGKIYELHTISCIPYTETQLWDFNVHELFYWDNGWHFVDEKQGNYGFLIFDKVPKNALLLLKVKGSKQLSDERIFIYKDNTVLFY